MSDEPSTLGKHIEGLDSQHKALAMRSVASTIQRQRELLTEFLEYWNTSAHEEILPVHVEIFLQSQWGEFYQPPQEK